LGLKARKVSRIKKYVSDMEWLKESIDTSTKIDDPCDTLNIDGGMINNEPFEKVQEVLAKITGQHSEDCKIKEGNEDKINDYDSFRSTVVMIDPFPSVQETFESDDHLFKVIGKTVSAMINHLRIKPGVLIDAMNSEKAGQFL